MIRAVLFDMDGVLAFTEQFYNRRRLAYLAEHGITFDVEPDWTGANDAIIWEESVPEAGLRERLREGYRTYVADHPTPWPKLANRQVGSTFSLLHERGVKVAICSSSWRNLIDEFVDQLGVGDLVDYVISGGECRAFKPAPDIYLKALRHFGLVPGEAIVVEDSPIGIEAGKAAGCLVCALRQPDGIELEQRGADLVIEHLSDVVDLVDQMGGGRRGRALRRGVA